MEYMECGSHEGIRRISVALDPETFRALRELTKKRGQTISQVVRSSIMMAYQSELEDTPSLKELVIYAELLHGGDHVILDIELWDAMLNEIEKSNSEEFWKLTEEEGYRHGIYFKSIDLTDLREILKYTEYKNWFKLKISSGCYTLVLPIPHSKNFIKAFLRGLFKALDISVDIIEAPRTLLLVERKKK